MTLSAVSDEVVTVAYETSDGTATAVERLHIDARDADVWHGPDHTESDDFGTGGERHGRRRGRDVHGDVEYACKRDDSAGATATGTILDDDGEPPPILPTLSIGDASGGRGRGEC